MPAIALPSWRPYASNCVEGTRVSSAIKAIAGSLRSNERDTIIDEKHVAEEECYDGLFVLRTDTDHDAETIARVYKMLWMVEDSFRTAKSIMETGPIFHKCDKSIRGHVFCSFLAMVLKRELKVRMEQKDLTAEWAEVIRGLDKLQQVELFLQRSRFLSRSQLKGDASQAIRAAEVALPPVLQEIA